MRLVLIRVLPACPVITDETSKSACKYLHNKNLLSPLYYVLKRLLRRLVNTLCGGDGGVDDEASTKILDDLIETNTMVVRQLGFISQ